MEDDKLKELFDSYQPRLSSDSLFMSQLRRNMESVELVRQHTAALRKRSRIAVCVAALAGFAAGVVLTLLMPLIGNTVSTYIISIPGQGPFDLTIDWQIVGWLVTGVVCVCSAINAFELTLAKLPATTE